MAEKELSNIDIALFALYRLGGAKGTVDTEDIAIECWRLAPEKFSWKKYPQYPDADVARVTLFDAAKPKYGKLVRGRNKRTGWMLTITGLDHVKSRLPVLEGLASGTAKIASHHRELDSYFASLEKETAYKKFLQSRSCESVAAHEFTQLLRCPLDASPHILRDRMEKLKTKAREANRDEFVVFLLACEEHFDSMLDEQ